MVVFKKERCELVEPEPGVWRRTVLYREFQGERVLCVEESLVSFDLRPVGVCYPSQCPCWVVDDAVIRDAQDEGV